ncbi:hypothetical protein [Sporomusa termitida]|uniref:hypothetical protein n=1 Tax=Sporomusa termitida TaxID=2377 RepID=UPI001185B297|nr:hypothetical protein [Sporomusa termitida]
MNTSCVPKISSLPIISTCRLGRAGTGGGQFRNPRLGSGWGVCKKNMAAQGVCWWNIENDKESTNS